jgi:integrase
MKVSGTLERRERKTGDVWMARLRIDGKPKKVTLGKCWEKRGEPDEGFLTEVGAKDALNDLMADIRAGRVVYAEPEPTPAPTANSISLEVAGENWMTWGEYEKEWTGPTIGRNRSRLKGILDHFGANTPVEDITTEQADEFKKKLIQAGKSTQTIAHYMIALNGIFKRAIKDGKRSDNPMVGVEWRVPKSNMIFNVFIYEDLLALAEAAATPWEASLYLIAGLCGLRTGELRGLMWKHIVEADGTIYVHYNFPIGTRKQGGVVSLPPEKEWPNYLPKSKKPRPVPLPDQVVPYLRKHRLASAHSQDTDLVFPEPTTGNLFRYYTVRRRFKAATKRAGLDERRFHDLRHSAATIFARIFPNAFDVQDILGHADLKTTRKYVHMRPKGDEAKRLSDALAAEDAKAKKRRRAA